MTGMAYALVHVVDEAFGLELLVAGAALVLQALTRPKGAG
jgi:hypothetical protein